MSMKRMLGATAALLLVSAQFASPALSNPETPASSADRRIVPAADHKVSPLQRVAQAPSDADRKALRLACVSDAKKLCATVPRGSGRIRECLVSHAKDLSDACREGLARAGLLATR